LAEWFRGVACLVNGNVSFKDDEVKKVETIQTAMDVLRIGLGKNLLEKVLSWREL
jgi:hypothetical protein